MENVFKIYDIRGEYPEQIDERFAYNLGRGIVTLLDCKKIVIGRDMRIGSPELYKSLAKGITDSGCEILNVGVVSTPICSFANTYFNADASIMITGSHHDKKINGFKISKENSIPLSQLNGLTQLKQIIDYQKFNPLAEKKASTYDKNIDSEYYDEMISHLNIDKEYKIVCDYSNSIGVVETYGLRRKIKLISLNNKINSEFPIHNPDPIRENLKELARKVRLEDADFGIALDGDADRIAFVDEFGEIIPADIIISIIAKNILKTNTGEKIVFDVRCTDTLKDTIKENKGEEIISKTGYPFINDLMVKNDAILGGELSGHIFFKSNSYRESPLLAIIQILNIIDSENISLYNLTKEFKKYAKADEIVIEIDDSDRILEKLEVFYYNGKPTHIDGLTLKFKDWWFNVRKSHTEHTIKINIEAEDKNILKEKKYELLKTIEKITAHEI